MDLSPSMRRIRIRGEALTTMQVDLPGQWLKVFFPGAEGERAHGRAYTIRSRSADGAMMDLDFVLHGIEGGASRWALQARVGEILDVAGPREGYRIDTAIRDHLLIGDATALPAIAAIAEALPDRVTAHIFVEINHGDETALVPRRENTVVHAFVSDTREAGTTGRIEAVLAEAMLPSSPQVFLAGEAIMVRRVCARLWARGVPRGTTSASGYWREGVADHRDRALDGDTGAGRLRARL